MQLSIGRAKLKVITPGVLAIVMLFAFWGKVCADSDQLDPHYKYNPERFKHSCAVIEGYLEQALKDIKYAHQYPALSYYVAHNLELPNTPTGTGLPGPDFDPTQLDALYDTATTKITEEKEKFSKAIANLTPNRQLAYDNGPLASSFGRVNKMVFSPYPTGGGGSYLPPFLENDDNNKNGVSDAKEYYNALVEYDLAVVAAQKKYISDLLAYEQRLQRTTSDKDIDSRILNLMDWIAGEAYWLANSINQFSLEQEEQKYESYCQLYDAWASYFDSAYETYFSYNSLVSGYWVVGGTAPASYGDDAYVEENNFHRTGWNSWSVGYVYTGQYTGNPPWYPYGTVVTTDARGFFPWDDNFYVQLITLDTSDGFDNAALNDAAGFAASANSILSNYPDYTLSHSSYKIDQGQYLYDPLYFHQNSDPAPVLSVSVDAPVQQDIPFTATLKAKIDYGIPGYQNKDLSYRWILKEIPNTDSARSRNYVQYQTISTSDTAELTPDLADPKAPTMRGNWEVVLEVHDNYQQASTGWIPVYANRKILWVAHSNGPYPAYQNVPLTDEPGLGIELVLYQPDENTLSDKSNRGGMVWKGPYYLEVAHEKSGVYLNYDDANKPVDPTSYSPGPEPGNCCFVLTKGRSSAKAGAYDGKYGSDDLGSINPIILNTKRFHLMPGDFTLASASSYNDMNSDKKVVIHIDVTDPQITDLVYPSDDCSFDMNKHFNPGDSDRWAEYSIQQWVNHYTWINKINADGKYSFKPQPVGRNPQDNTPDWMERRTAETLNLFPEVLPYPERILVKNTESGGSYWDGEKSIHIKPTEDLIRYNLRGYVDGSGFLNIYGFTGGPWLDDVARHESFHCFFYWTVSNPLRPQAIAILYPDKDGDGLPGVTGGPMSGTGGNAFEYLYDDGDTHGKFGPVPELYPGTRYSIHYNYNGDRGGKDSVDPKGRNYPGKEKKYMVGIPFTGINDIITKSYQLDVPLLYPIERVVWNKTGDGLYLKTSLSDVSKSVIQLSSNLMEVVALKKHTVDPEIKVLFCNKAAWLQELRRKGIKESDIDSIYVGYTVITPYDSDEYDASRIQPGLYTGAWIK